MTLSFCWARGELSSDNWGSDSYSVDSTFETQVLSTDEQTLVDDLLISHHLYVLYYYLHFNGNLDVGETHLFDIMMDCAVDFDVEPISKIVCKRKTNKMV